MSDEKHWLVELDSDSAHYRTYCGILLVSARNGFCLDPNGDGCCSNKSATCTACILIKFVRDSE